MVESEFVHTHVHSDYSILDASISVPALVAEAKAKGMKALALTDHGNVHGAVQFYTECKKQGIKPILGCEVYVARKSALEKMDRETNPTDHLVLLARDKEGYENILKLVSWAFQHGMHYVGRVDIERLRAHSKGIIAQTACLSGGVNRLLRGWEYGSKEKGTYREFAPNIEEAARLASTFQEIFGKDGFFMEVQHHHGPNEDPVLLAKQRALAEQAFRLAARLGIPMVATNDIHFKGPKDAAAREMAYRIARGGVETSDSDTVNHAAEFFVKSPDEMFAAFQGWDEQPLKNTLWIAEQCNVELELEKHHFAHPIDEQGEMTPERMKETWQRWVNEGFSVRYGEHYPERQKAWERVLYEKETIEKMGFVPYFLVVADFIRYAKSRGIPVGPGRGSVGGCAVAYCLGITELDPLEYDLIFERFLNPERISMPDIDVDFDKDRVHEVLEYVIRKYGRERVARISAFGKMWAKAALNDVGRMMNIPPEEVKLLTEDIPDAAGEFRMSIGEAIEEVDAVREWAKSEDPERRRYIELASSLEGVKRNVTTHACGIVIADEPLEKYCALMPVKDEDFGGMLQSQLDMESLEKLGLLKYDFLALDTLTIIARAEKHIRQRKDPTFSVAGDRTRKDPETYKMLSQGRTVGAFQIEKPGMRELTMLVQPKTLEDVSMILALYRPGPLDAKEEEGQTMLDHYVMRRSGHEPVHYHHESMKPVLEVSHGILVYQEQIMRIAQRLCGYSMAQADNLRKGIGKKKPELVKKEREKFIPAAIKHSGITEELATKIWNEIETFARYGFNKSHSIGYAVLTYQTVFLKTHFPVEFMAATLSAACGYTDVEYREIVPKKSKSEAKVKRLVDEANRLGITVLAPHVNFSDEECLPEGERSIRMGFTAIKGLGQNGGKLISARTQAGGKFKNFTQFMNYARGSKVDTGALQALILSGACDDLGERNQMLSSIDAATAAAKETAKMGGGVPSFVEIPEELPSGVFVMPENQLLSNTLELVGAYDIKPTPPSVITGLVIGQLDLMKVIEYAQAHPGKTPLRIAYSPYTTRRYTAFFEIGSISNDEAVIAEISKYVMLGVH